MTTDKLLKVMSGQNISADPTEAKKNAILQKADEIKVLRPFLENLSRLLTTCFVLFVAETVNAQAPSSIAGKTFAAAIADGTSPPFADYGYFIVLPANTGNSYQVIGIYGVANSSGTYTWSASGATGAGIFTDSAVGPVNGRFDFFTSSSGNYSLTAGPYYQAGEFEAFSRAAPNSVAGTSFFMSVDDGLYPYAYRGTATLKTAASGNSYTITGDGINIANSSGTYTYSKLNTTTGRIQLTDSAFGIGTAYIAFSNPTAGGYAVKQPSSGGFQIGHFVVLDSTRPTVLITNPPAAKTYTNAQAVLLSATASDNVGVAMVEFYDGSMLQGSDTTKPYTYNWSFTAADNGPHVWRARAYDAAGNVSTSSPVTLTVSIDITPPTVAISRPTNGAILTTLTNTVSGTASDPGSPKSGISVVHVRVNGGSWQTASGTTNWSRSVTLSPCSNTIEARSRDKAGNYSSIASIPVTYTPPNKVPKTPTNVAPANGATDVLLTPTLQASAFSDPDCVGDTHAASQWQVLNDAGTVVVVNSGTDTVNRLSWTVPAGKLYYGSNYQWRVRYLDSRNGWSTNSTRTRFTTLGPLLSASRQGTNIVLRWPTNAPGFKLQWTTNFGAVNWSNATPSPTIASGQYTVTNGITNRMRFYRLKK